MQQPDTSTAAETSKPGRRRRFLRPKPIIWTLVGVLAFCIVVMGVSAFVAKSSVDKLMAEARELSASLNDPAAMADRADAMRGAAQTAHFATAHPIWRATEVLPFVGDDLRAVRVLASTADDLIESASPLLEFDFASLGPNDGALNLDAVDELGSIVAEVAPEIDKTNVRLVAQGVDTSALLTPLRGPAETVVESVDTAAQVARRFAMIAPQLSDMLGAESPQNYLLLVQNNAEARTTGGNPGTQLMLTLDQGRMAITQQANAVQLGSGRDTPIVGLNEWTEALYGDKVGRYVQDTTMTPDFRQTAHLARAFWQESIGDPGRGVISIDPVALGYLLKATGPVPISNTTMEITSDNAASLLLNKIYFRYPSYTDMAAQEEFFGNAAQSVFNAILAPKDGLGSLVTQIVKGASEGRIMYASTDPNEAAAVAGTRLQGPLFEDDNSKTTSVGAFVNDNTEGKLDYYTEMSVAASSNMCEAGDDPATFTLSADYEYTLDPAEVESLPWYISTANYFPKGVKSTNLVFYGPVGSTFVSAKVDGQDYVPVAGTNDQGRAAVRILIENQPATSHTVEVTFEGGEGQEYGPLDVRTTPLANEVSTSTNTPGCQ